ncbi:E3 ubiquitin-protein ligase PRT1-like [Musa acuminata AAA Group]|uniref:E3 ubiquitin-protein ligase PRT1-like n=1 Tax=Musa acuminata AAA Group TaxID=214697 RepID=UPI0031D870EB
MKRHIFVDDKSCSLCKEMLYQPAVLNRGHGYILCLANLSDLSGEPLQCQICESLDPGEFPNVFLDLDHFLEEEFLRVCSEKRTSKAQCQPANSSTSTLQPKKLKAKVPCEAMGLLWLNEDTSAFIVGVVCDSCEIYLIIGKRYKCKDWKEAVGFDLCEACYKTKSKLPGRFNQQHTPDHKFELDELHMLRNILLRRASMFNIAQQRPEVVCPYG